MTLIDAIHKVDALKPNTYPQTEKVRWLSALDSLIMDEIISTHEGAEEVSFSGYTDETPTSTVLLAKEPYDEMYIAWLESKIDLHNAEYGKYNNSITTFNAHYKAFSNYYNRTHMPKGTKMKYN